MKAMIVKRFNLSKSNVLNEKFYFYFFWMIIIKEEAIVSTLKCKTQNITH